MYIQPYGKISSLVGGQFGRLTVEDLHGTDKHCGSVWVCSCSCGKIVNVKRSHLMSGQTKSCGCLGYETRKKNGFKKKHGLSGTNIYWVWRSMFKKKPKIVINKRWLKFENFYKDMYDKYLDHWKKNGKKNTVLERINRNIGHGPKNCEWVTWSEHNGKNNHSRQITCDGKTMSLYELKKHTGLSSGVIRRRRISGWSLERIMSTPLRKKNALTFMNKTLSITEWAKELNIPRSIIAGRMQMPKWKNNAEKILTTPIHKKK